MNKNQTNQQRWYLIENQIHQASSLSRLITLLRRGVVSISLAWLCPFDLWWSPLIDYLTS